MITRKVINMKIWKIMCCANCPKESVDYNNNGSYSYCYMQRKRIDDILKLPKWCPLPDYEEDK